MASLQSVNVGRHTDDRLVESRRVNGTPRPIPVWPLGTADQRLPRRLTHPQPPVTLRAYPQGEVAAVQAMADRLGLVARIERHLPASRRPRAMGTTRVRAAIKRAVWPCATRAWAVGAQRTSRPHLGALRPAARTSPYVWEQMDAVSGGAVAAIDAALTRPVVQDVQRTRDALVDATANVFPSLARGHERSA